MMEKAFILNEDDIDRVLRRISHEILEKNKGSENLVFVGLHKRGVYLANRIVKNIESFEGVKIKAGKLDIEFGCFGNSSPPFKNSYLEMKVENKGQSLGFAHLSSVSGSSGYSPEIEKYMTLYRKIKKEVIEKNVRKIDQAREEGFREARKLLKEFDISSIFELCENQ